MMMKPQKILVIGLLLLALVPGFTGIAGAAYPITISGYVGMNNTGASSLAYPGMLGGWTVDLKKAPYTTTLATTTTDGTGFYSFTLTSGTFANYRTFLTVQPGYKAANPSTAGSPTLLGVDGSKSYSFVNFSVYRIPEVTVQGHAYLDPTGRHNAPSPAGIEGLTIQLTNTAGKVLASTVTKSDGSYSLTVPDFGVTYVKEVEQAGYKKTWPLNFYSHIILKGATGTITDDFWNAAVMDTKISGHLYQDPDGKHTSTSVPLAGWTMKLLQQQGTVFVEIASTPTNGEGYYEFPHISVLGHYLVKEVVPDTYKPSDPVSGERGFIIDYSTPDQVADFWNYQLPSVTISGHLYADPDGSHTSTDKPVGGVTMELSRGLTKMGETTTNDQGEYSFQVTDMGSWRVAEVVPSGSTQTWPYSVYSYMIMPGQSGDFVDQDFWNAEVMDTTISGHLYQDPDGKHTDTSSPLAGWTVQLLQQQGSDFAVIASTATDDSGSYKFTGISAPGHYLVRELLHYGYKPSDPVSNQVGFMLDYSSTDQVADFWIYERPLVSISGFVYADPDGTHTSTDTPMEGVTMELFLGLTKMGETVTNSDGAYSFEVTDLGSWRVADVVPDGYTQTWPYSIYGYMILPGDMGSYTDQDFWARPT
jgi:protocatechuate 3,4-dioxygenase beta subunit